MKKLVSLLAVVLSMVILAAPVHAAAADDMNLYAVQIYDPVVTIDGVPMLDLSGLTLQLAGAATEDASLVQLFLDILGGGNPINSAMLQLDSNGLAGYLGGMSNAYGIPMAVIEAAASELMASLEEMLASVPAEAALTSELAEWTLPQQILDTVNRYVEANIAPAQNYTRDIDLATGTTTVEYEAYTVKCNDLIPQITALLDSDETAMQFLQMLNAEGAVYAESYSELIPTDSFTYTLTLGEAFGDKFTGEDVILRMDDGEMAVNFAFTSVSETIGESDSSSHYGLSIYPEAEEYAGEEVYVTFDAASAAASSSFSGHFGYNVDGEIYDIALMGTASENSFNATLSDTEGAINAFCTYTPGAFKLNITVDGEPLNIYANWNEGGFDAGVSASGVGGITIAYTSENNPAYLLRGRLEFTFDDTYSITGFSTGIAAISGTRSSSASYISPESMIDITTISEEQMLTAEEEAMTILQNNIISLVDYVPVLGELLGIE